MSRARELANFGDNTAGLETLTVSDITDLTATATELNHSSGVGSALQTQIDAKAPLASPTFTGTVSGVTKTHVGLGNVTNESKATMFTSPTFTGTTTVADFVPATPLSHRNLIINGAMQVAQRGVSTTHPGTGGVYLIDRFKGYAGGGGVYTMEQSTTVPNNTFKNSAKLVVTQADSSIGSDNYYSLNYGLEGNDIIRTGYGTSDAKSLSLSFQVRSSVAGTYCVTCYNHDGSRGYLNTFTLSADTWTDVNLTWVGDTGGTWNKDNTLGMWIRFDLGSGSDGHGTANQWTTSGTFAANRTSGSVDWIANSSATFYLTGVQLELGSVATPFEMRSYGEELARCQRYYQKSYNIETEPGTATSTGTEWLTLPSSGRIATTTHYQTEMRDNATVKVYDWAGTIDKVRIGSGDNHGIFTIYQSKKKFVVDLTTSTSTTELLYQWTANAEL